MEQTTVDGASMNGESGSGTAAIEAQRQANVAALAAEVRDRVRGELHETEAQSGWYMKLIAYALRRRARQVAKCAAPPVEGVPRAARSAILRASLKSALSGAAAGSVSTAATLVTAQTEGVAGLVAIPVAALSVGAEMLYRSLLHFELTLRLSELFDVPFHAADPVDIVRLYSLVFRKDRGETEEVEGSSFGRDLVHQVKHLESAEVGEEIGNRILGESVVRNVIPFVGIVSSALTNFIVTRRLGVTVSRYLRYQRAIDEAFERASRECVTHLDLLVEGIWFIFTADGSLAPEETVTLVKLLERLDPIGAYATLARFVEDELDWAERIEDVPAGMRAAFFWALEVAACVDMSVSLPERKILRRAAHHLGLEFDLARLDAMVADLDREGVFPRSKG